jgi:hypothetical protein
MGIKGAGAASCLPLGAGRVGNDVVLGVDQDDQDDRKPRKITGDPE